jgi:purine-binding chemotaxis protein CheW
MLLVAFTLDEQRYALPLDAVERVLRAVEVTGVPDSPQVLAGIVNLHGEIVPVVDLRRRFGLAERALAASDQFIVTRSAQRRVAVIADHVSAVVDCNDDDLVEASPLLSGAQQLGGVAKSKEGVLVVIRDLEHLLSSANA